MRRFVLRRDKDVSGLSGTGYVASGIEWVDGPCAMRWNTHIKTTTIYDSVQDLLALHGHEGKSTVEWLDKPNMHRFWEGHTLNHTELSCLVACMEFSMTPTARKLIVELGLAGEDFIEGLLTKLRQWRDKDAPGRPQDPHEAWGS